MQRQFKKTLMAVPTVDNSTYNAMRRLSENINEQNDFISSHRCRTTPRNQKVLFLAMSQMLCANRITL